MVFPGPWVGCIPFLILGITLGQVRSRAFRWLPIFILLTPFFISLYFVTSAYPRIFLFNLPFLLLFTSSGIYYTSFWIAGRLKSSKNNSLWIWILPALFTAMGIYTILFKTFPSMNTPDGKRREKQK